MLNLYFHFVHIKIHYMFLNVIIYFQVKKKCLIDRKTTHFHSRSKHGCYDVEMVAMEYFCSVLCQGEFVKSNTYLPIQ